MIHAQTMRCASLSRSMASKSRLNKKWDSRYLEPRIVSVEPGQSHENSKGSENAMVELQQPENVASLLSSPGILLHSLSFLGPFLLRGFLDEEFQPEIQQKSSHSRRDRLHWTIRNSHTHTLHLMFFANSWMVLNVANVANYHATLQIQVWRSKRELDSSISYILWPSWTYRKFCINTSSTAQGGGGSFKNRKPIGEIGCCESGMAERSHWWTERCLISLTLSLSFSGYLPTYPSIFYVSIHLLI